MGLRNSSVMCLTLLLAFSSAINGLDITKILGQYPEFATFNKYLTETKLAEQINSRNAVTILALDNTALSSLSGKSLDAVKATIGTQVVVGYYDEKKLVEAVGSHTQLPTLSNPIYVNLINEGEIAFASALQGSAYDTKLVSTVTTQPETVSILQVSQPIVVPSAAPLTPPASSNAHLTPDSSDGPLTPPASSDKATPTPTTTTTTPASVAESPKSVDAPAPAPSSSYRTQIGFFGAVIAFVSLFVSL